MKMNMTLGIGRSLRRAISVTTGVVLIASLGAVGSMPASATSEGGCDGLPPFNENLEANSDGDWGSIEFAGSDSLLDLVVNDGYEVTLCLKAGSEASGGGAISDGPYPAGVHNDIAYDGAERVISHYDFSFVEVETDTEVTADVDFLPSVCDGNTYVPASYQAVVKDGVTYSPAASGTFEAEQTVTAAAADETFVLTGEDEFSYTNTGPGPEGCDIDEVVVVDPRATAKGACTRDGEYVVKYTLDNSLSDEAVIYTVVIDDGEPENVTVPAGGAPSADFTVAEDTSSTLKISVGGKDVFEETFPADCVDDGGFVDDCPEGSVFYAKFDEVGGKLVLTEGANAAGIVITSVLIEDGELVGGTFTVAEGFVITTLVIKGGNDDVDYAVTAGENGVYTFTNAELPPVGNGGTNLPGISNIQFCGEVVDEGEPTPPMPVLTKVAIPASGSVVKPGDEIDYTVTVENTGELALNDQTLVDTLPENVTVEEDSILVDEGVATLDEDLGEITWEFDLPGKTSYDLTYTVTVDADAANGAVLTNTATWGDLEKFTTHTVRVVIAPAAVTPIKPMVIDSVCVGNASNGASAVEIFPAAGVEYSIGDTVLTKKITDVADGTTVTVVARPTANNTFTGPQSVSYVLTFGTPNCTPAPAVVVNPPPAPAVVVAAPVRVIPTVTQAAAQPRALARTGVELWSVALIAGLLLASGAAMVGLTTTGNAKGRRQA